MVLGGFVLSVEKVGGQMAKTKSKKQVWYRQCVLASPTEEGQLKQVAWIPEKFAQEGRKIYLGKKTKTPDRIWIVEKVSPTRQSGDYLAEHERDYLTQRDASDI